MNIVVTGEVGIGKTTVCQNVVELLQKDGYVCTGILTPKILAGSKIAGIDVVDVSSGQRKTLANVDGNSSGLRIGKYSFDHDGIAFGTEALNKGPSADLMVVDELGYLELQGEGFIQALDLIKTDKVGNSILIIRSKLLPLFLPLLERQTHVFHVDDQNRDMLPVEIYSLLGGILANTNIYS